MLYRFTEIDWYILNYLRRNLMHKQPTDRRITSSYQRTLTLRKQPLSFMVTTRIVLFMVLVSITCTFTSVVHASQATSRHTSAKGEYQPAPANTAYLTYKYDNMRTGQNPNETQLNESTVNSSMFGKHVSYSVDGQVYAQPLF